MENSFSALKAMNLFEGAFSAFELWRNPEFTTIHDISDAVGPDSWFLLNVAGVDGDFLDKPVFEWARDSSYEKLKDFISKMSVVNDVSEWGVNWSRNLSTPLMMRNCTRTS